MFNTYKKEFLAILLRISLVIGLFESGEGLSENDDCTQCGGWYV